MFREHVKYLQHELLSTFAMLPQHTKEYIQKSWAGIFFNRIFGKINENKFSVLFSNKKSRPNFPINIYVALEIMKNLFNWSDEEMISNFHFNLQVCYAVGIENLGEMTVAPRTIYYNRTRIIDYEEKTGVNLFEEVFQEITLEEIKALGLDTSIQRMDSSMISSNIKKMSRLELDIKVLQNFYHELPEEEQRCLYTRIKDYVKSDAENLTFKLKNSDLDEQLKTVGELLLYIHTYYQNNKSYHILKSFAHVQRVLDEQFVVQDDDSTISLKPPDEIPSSSLQNPADDEATYRSKKNKDYQGYALNISETCSKNNKTQLITDVSLYTNNTSDEQILEERIEQIKERTGVEELVVDGGYSGETSENGCEKQDVKLIFTGIKGAKQSDDKIALYNFKLNENGIESCPQGHKPISDEYKLDTGRHVVHFDKEQCSQCPLREQCCVQDKKKFTTFYFTDQQMRVARKRQQFTEEEYRAKQKLRPAIEGTISLFKRRVPNGKVRVRGLKRVRNVAILTALAINFHRIAVVIDDIFYFFYYFAIKTFKVELKIT